MRKTLAVTSVALLAVGLCAFAVRAEEKEIDNPEFKVWSTCGKGTSVTYSTEMVMEMNGAKQPARKGEMTLTLVEVSAEQCVLETTTPGTKAGIPKRTVKPKLKVDTEKGDTEPKKTGSETIKADDGKEYKCDIYEVERDVVQGAMKSHLKMKVWRCEDVPGGTVRSVTNTKGDKFTNDMTMLLVKFEKK